jgi:hypothetical protein
MVSAATNNRVRGELSSSRPVGRSGHALRRPQFAGTCDQVGTEGRSYAPPCRWLGVLWHPGRCPEDGHCCPTMAASSGCTSTTMPTRQEHDGLRQKVHSCDLARTHRIRRGEHHKHRCFAVVQGTNHGCTVLFYDRPVEQVSLCGSVLAVFVLHGVWAAGFHPAQAGRYWPH